MPVKEPIQMTPQAWREEAIRRFGPDRMKWKFVCPSCKRVTSIQEWKDAGASDGFVAFSCIGRLIKEDPAVVAARSPVFGDADGACNYTGGGLIGLNPVHVDVGSDKDPVPLFAFAEAEDWTVVV